MATGSNNERLLNPQDYPDVAAEVIQDYNSKLRILSEENKKLKTTIAKLMRDIDRNVSGDLERREQLEIIAALSRDYLNVYQIDVRSRKCRIIKLDGYVIKGIDTNKSNEYPYNRLVEQYIADRVYQADADVLRYAMSLEKVIRELSSKQEYVSGYRVLINGEIHYYQFKYLKLDGQNENGNIIVAFKNIDSIVHEAEQKNILKAKAETDLMTGLLNRGSGQDRATESISLGCGGMLCIIDIDKFKSINDTYGHNVGDQVIIEVAGCLKKVFRNDDVVFRLGGDEFAALAPNVKSKTVAKTIITRFFKNLEKMDIPELDKRKVTASVGIVMLDEAESRDFNVLYEMADSCLYKSKESKGCAATFYRKKSKGKA